MAVYELPWGELLGSITPSPSPWNGTSQTQSQHKAFLPENVFLRSFITMTKNEHICIVFPLGCAVPILRLTCSTSLATFIILWVYQFVCLLLLALIMYPSSWEIRCNAYAYGLLFTLKRSTGLRWLSGWRHLLPHWTTWGQFLGHLLQVAFWPPRECHAFIHVHTHTFVKVNPIRCCSWVEIEATMLS